MRRAGWSLCAWVLLAAVGALWAQAGSEPGESGALPPERLDQAEIAAGHVELDDLRRMGLVLFSTALNRHDGYGDGPVDPTDTTSPGGRPTLGGNGTFLRINGLDARSCLECHSLVSAATMPPRLGIGGVGGSNANALIGITSMDPVDQDLDGAAHFNGRMANPPFLFGTGGVELLALEMTADLQALAQRALDTPGADIELLTKGVHFGALRANRNGALDFSGVTGIEDDLVVRPFGRKGEFSTVRDFDLGALQFHMGIQPTEIVGVDVDADGDGVVNEILPGDLTALHAFAVTLERPFMERLSPNARRGSRTFGQIGCVGCHKPYLDTERSLLPLRFPEVAVEPWANTFLQIDLTAEPMHFRPTRRGGIRVPLFADLKRHDMGEGLREHFAQASDQQNREFTTARLWGVADTAPYLHDGRATTLTDAILFHGGEAQQARDAFADLTDQRRIELLTFLRSLRTPDSPAKDIIRRLAREQRTKKRPRAHAKKQGPVHRRSSTKSDKSNKSGRSRKARSARKPRRHVAGG